MKKNPYLSKKICQMSSTEKFKRLSSKFRILNFCGLQTNCFTVVTFSNLPPDQKHNHQNNKKHTIYTYYHRRVFNLNLQMTFHLNVEHVSALLCKEVKIVTLWIIIKVISVKNVVSVKNVYHILALIVTWQADKEATNTKESLANDGVLTTWSILKLRKDLLMLISKLII